jgi:hypothetical protein
MVSRLRREKQPLAAPDQCNSPAVQIQKETPRNRSVHFVNMAGHLSRDASQSRQKYRSARFPDWPS